MYYQRLHGLILISDEANVYKNTLCVCVCYFIYTTKYTRTDDTHVIGESTEAKHEYYYQDNLLKSQVPGNVFKGPLINQTQSFFINYYLLKQKKAVLLITLQHVKYYPHLHNN